MYTPPLLTYAVNLGIYKSPSSASLWGRPGLAPSAVHFSAATVAASLRLSAFDMPVMIPTSIDPMEASPAPVVSSTLSCIVPKQILKDFG